MRAQIQPLKLIFTLALLCTAGAVVPGCGGPAGGDFCDAEASCEGWSPGQYNSCLSGADNDELLASRFGCGPFLDQLLACKDATGFCSGGRDWETSCKHERDNFNHCVGR